MADQLFEELKRLASTTSAPAGTCLFRQDEPSTSVYILRSGNIALLWPGAEEAVPMEVLKPGSIIGLPAALNGTYSVTGKAIIDSEVGVISATRVLELIECNPAFCPENHADDGTGSRQPPVVNREALQPRCVIGPLANRRLLLLLAGLPLWFSNAET